ncbi:MFS transporter [Rothia nasimurium]|uniref:MFS transporter n=1 Tax=Rothia nasimurium TaxID=85336 RepID=UPI001F00245F|nr:MFS transporter [Rothia nasimurium]
MSAASTIRGDLKPGASRALLASMLGTLVEWYDYALYGAAASLIIGPLFFSQMDSGATIAAFATFAVGFVARPLGGLLIAWLGDKRGRKPAMMLTIIIMGVSTVGIGLLPTAEFLGAWAVFLLVFLRLLQGLGAGAELTGALTLVAEYTPVQRRGFWTSLVLAMPPAGSLLATLSFMLVSTLPEETFMGIGWRIPFLASVVLFAVAIFIRNKLEESPEYQAAMASRDEKQQKSSVPLAQVIRENFKQVVIGFMAVTGHNANNYIISIVSITVMTTYGNLDRTTALTAVMLATVFGIVLSPVGGALGDKIGAGKTMMIGATIGLLFAFPLFMSLTSGSFLMSFAALAISFGVVLSTTSGPQGAFLVNLFPIKTRFTGVALARETNGVIIAGFTPMIVAWLFTAGEGSIVLPATYMMLCFAVTIIATVWAKESGNNSAAQTV